MLNQSRSECDAKINVQMGTCAVNRNRPIHMFHISCHIPIV